MNSFQETPNENYNNEKAFSILKQVDNSVFVEIKSKNELLQHPTRETITSIKYSCDEMLIVGDLPTGGALKHLELNNEVFNYVTFEFIPQGVETLILSQYGLSGKSIPSTKFSTLPTSINSVANARFYDEDFGLIEIPSNITALSFASCTPSLNIVPTTVKSLKVLNESLQAGDVKEGVTNFSNLSYRVQSATESVLPKSLIELDITYGDALNMHMASSKNEFNFPSVVPSNVQSLYIQAFSSIEPKSNLSQCSTIKKLAITPYMTNVKVLPNSLPSNVNHLILSNLYTLESNVIPSSVKTLDLSLQDYAINSLTLVNSNSLISNGVTSLRINRLINQFPESLTCFEYSFNGNNAENTVANVETMLSNLPKSVTSITLPKLFENKLTNSTNIKYI